MRHHLIALAVASGVAAAQPAPSPAPSPEVDEGEPQLIEHQRTLDALRNRRVPAAVPVKFRFGSLERQRWPELRVREIRPSPSGPVVLIAGEPRPYSAGETVRGARVVRVTTTDATFELGAERQTVAAPRTFPALVVRVIRKVEGELVAFVEGERRPLVAGDTVREARVLRVEPDAVTFAFGDQVRRIQPARKKPPFPQIVFAGFVQMAGGPVVLVRGRTEPVRVGDVIDGARIAEVTPTHVTVEFEGERRRLPIR